MNIDEELEKLVADWARLRELMPPEEMMMALAAALLRVRKALEGMCAMSGHGVECDSWETFDEALIRHPEKLCTCPKAAAAAALAFMANASSWASVVLGSRSSVKHSVSRSTAALSSLKSGTICSITSAI